MQIELLRSTCRRSRRGQSRVKPPGAVVFRKRRGDRPSPRTSVGEDEADRNDCPSRTRRTTFCPDSRPARIGERESAIAGRVLARADGKYLRPGQPHRETIAKMELTTVDAGANFDSEADGLAAAYRVPLCTQLWLLNVHPRPQSSTEGDLVVNPIQRKKDPLRLCAPRRRRIFDYGGPCWRMAQSPAEAVMRCREWPKYPSDWDRK